MTTKPLFRASPRRSFWHRYISSNWLLLAAVVVIVVALLSACATTPTTDRVAYTPVTVDLPVPVSGHAIQLPARPVLYTPPAAAPDDVIAKYAAADIELMRAWINSAWTLVTSYNRSITITPAPPQPLPAPAASVGIQR